MITTFMIGFTNYYYIGLFGRRDYKPTMELIWLIFGYRFFLVLLELHSFHKKTHIKDAKFSQGALIILFHFCLTGYLCYQWFESKQLEGQNIFCKYWIQTTVIMMLIEPISQTLRIMFHRYNDRKQKDNYEKIKSERADKVDDEGKKVGDGYQKDKEDK